ncbi:hypothetical protein T484DRAFT_3545300 [Baffinella frigidus]|nr:hypothetical protein T484DRAFT_3545300 [Cryptophyta sp. CCMP2293]
MCCILETLSDLRFQQNEPSAIMARQCCRMSKACFTTRDVNAEVGVRGDVSVIKSTNVPKHQSTWSIAGRFSPTDSSKHDTQVPPALHFGGSVLPILLSTHLQGPGRRQSRLARFCPFQPGSHRCCRKPCCSRLFKREREVQGSGFRVHGSGFRVQGSGFRVQGSGFRVQGLAGRS